MASGTEYRRIRELVGDDRHWDTDVFALRLLPYKVDEEGHIEVDAPEVQVAFPPGTIQSIALSEPFAVSAHPGLGGSLIVEESGHVVGRTLTCQGVYGKFSVNDQESLGAFSHWLTGFEARSEDSVVNKFYVNRHADSSGGISKVSSQKFIEMVQDQLFRRYSAYKQSGAKSVVMSFHDFKMNEHFLVVPLGFSIGRTARALGVFRFELLVVDYFAAMRRRSASSGRSLLGQVRRGVAAFEAFVQGVVDAVNGRINAIRNLINEVKGFVQRIGDAISSFASIIDTVADGIRSIESAVATLGRLPFAVANSFISATRNLVSAAKSLASGDYISAVVMEEARKLERNADLLALAVQLDTSSAPVASTSRISSTVVATGSRALTSNIPPATTRVDSIRSGESFYAFVERVRTQFPQLPHAAVALKVIELNSLKAPFVSLVGAPGTIQPGRDIIVPSNAADVEPSLNAGVLPARRGASTLEKLYGRDLRLVESSDGLLDIDLQEGGEIKQHFGLDCFVHSVQTRLKTTQGDSAVFPALGLNLSVGRPNSVGTKSLLIQDVRTELQSDPWIPSTGPIQVELDGDKIAISVAVSPDIPVVSVRRP